MQITNSSLSTALALVITGILVSLPVYADRGGNKHEKHERHQQKERHSSYEEREHDEDGDDDERYRSSRRYFDDRSRTIINNYYIQEFRGGRCPPGLLKKNNGCMPPGQRKWAIGRPLPRDIEVYDLPPSVIYQLGLPTQGYRYVRSATDILMISIGTGMVIDAIQNLGGL